MKKTKYTTLYLTTTECLTLSQLGILISKLSMSGIYSASEKLQGCNVHLKDNEINFLRRLCLWYKENKNE